MSNRVIDFKRDEWHTRQKLAELLGISVRTLYRRIEDGEIEVRDTPQGKRYRVAPEPTEGTGDTGLASEDDTTAADVPDGKIDSAGRGVAGEMLGLIREQLTQITDLEADRGRLRAELAATENDVTRAVDYVGQVEEELDRLHDERDGLEQALERERGRRLELEDHFEGTRQQLEELVGVRARYHLERGQREQAEQQREALRNELSELQRELDRLARQLDDEQQRRLRLALGRLSVEVRRSSNDS